MNKKDIKILDLNTMEFVKLRHDSMLTYKDVMYTDGNITRVGGKEEKEVISEENDFYDIHFLDVYRVDNASYITKVRYKRGLHKFTDIISTASELASAELYISDKNNKEVMKNIRSSIYDANKNANIKSKLPLSTKIFREKDISFDNVDENIKKRK